MSDNIKVDIDLGGKLAEGVKQAAQLRAHLEAAARIRFNEGTSSSIANKLSKGGLSGMGETKTARSIGSGSGTGSAASDFAAQAQGLGGLVHVYATFAANIYAVSAAFTALSKAADVSNMVKGMDQLGAASGRALGTLSKRLVEVTDGAISMKDSMNAVALASAGGMSNAAILRMGMVARQASIALGRDMPDAMERLSKGIIKVQPELLDELGIMTRVIPAQQAYALSIGKTVSGLTDLEKKQAFANAVLKEGEEKFGAIELSANNYSKILASMSNIAQTALEAVNKFLSPVVSLLATNPVALAGAMGLVASILLKQAIPALGYFKEQSAKAAEQAEALANRRNSLVRESLAKELAANLETTKKNQEAAKAAMKEEITAKRNHLEMLTQMEIDKVDAAEQQIRNIRDTSFKKSTASYKILSVTDPSQITEKQLKILEGQATRFAKAGEPDKAEAYTKAISAIKAWGQAEENYVRKDDQYKKELAEHSKALDKAYAEQEAANAKRLEARHTNLSIIGRLQTEADRANLAAATRNIASNAAQTASIEGFASAMKKAYAEIRAAMAAPITKTRIVDGIDEFGNKIQRTESIVTPKMGAMRAGWTFLSAGISSATTAISGFMNFLGPWAAFAGIATAAGTALYSWMTKTEKESAATTAAIEDLHAAMTAVDVVITSLSKKNPLDQISTESINSKAGAFTNLAEAISKSFSTASDELKKMGTIDILVDVTKFVIGKDVFTVAAKEASLGLAKSIKLMGNGPEAVQAKKEISKLLGGVDINSFEEINKFIGQNNATYFDRLPKINSILASLGQTMRDTASKALELDDAFKVASKTYDTITTGLMPTDNMAKLGFEMQTLGQKMAKAFDDPVTAISELVNIADDVTKLRFFDPKMAEVLLKDSASIKETAGALKVYTDLVSKLTQEEQTLQKQIEAHPTGGAELKVKKAEVAKQKAAIQDTVNTLTGTITPYLNMLKLAQNETFSSGAKLIANSIGIEFQKAGITISKAMSEGLGSTIGGIEQKARLDAELINVQIKQIHSQLSLVAVNEKLVALQEETLLRQQRKEMEEKGGADPLKYLEINDRIRAAEARRSTPILDSKQLAKQLQIKGDDAKLYAAQGSMNAVQQTEAGKAQIAALEAQKRAIMIAKDFAVMTELNNIEKDRLATQTSNFNIQKASLDDRSNSVLYISEELATAKNIKAEEIAKQATKAANLDIQLEYNKALKAAESTVRGTKAYKEAQLAIEQIEGKIVNKAVRDTNDELVRQLTYENNIRAAKLATLDAMLNIAKVQREIVDIRTSTDINVEEERLAIATAVNTIYADDIAKRTTALNIAKEELRSKQTLQALQDALAKEQTQLAFKLESSNLNESERKALVDQMNLNKALYDAKVEGEQRTTAAKVATLGVQGQMNELQAKHNQQLESMTVMVESLSVAFGTVGDAIGKMTSAILKSAQAQEKLDKQKENIKDAKEEQKYKKDQLNADLKGISEVTNATKEMFDVKSDGYKALSGIEKAFAVASTAVRAQEVASTIASTAAIVAARIPAIYASFMAAMGPFGPPAAALAIATFIGSIAGGSSGPAVYGGPSAADRQKLQGSGQEYDSNGNIVENGGGVLGDSAARSKSIDNALNIIKDTSVENLSYANKMLEALTSIKNNIGAAATALFKTSSINKKGSGFSISEGSSLDTGILGSVLSTVTDNAIFKLSDKLSLGTLSTVTDFFSRMIGGTTSSTSVTDQGVKISGTFNSVINNAQNALSEFTNVFTSWSSSFLGINTGGGSRTDQYTKSLDSSVTKAIQEIFSSASDMFIQYGSTLGKTSQSITQQLGSLDVSTLISLKGLSGQALTEAFTDSINGILDKAAKAVYPELLKFQRGGEAAFETVSRVLDSSYKVTLAFQSIGKSIDQLSSGMSGYNLSEGLIAAAGGLDTLLNQTKQFSEDFLTQAERAAPVQAQLIKRLSELGYSSIDTRDEFKQLILGFEFTNEASYKTYASLLALAPAFNIAYQSANKLRDELTLMEFNSSKIDLQIKVLTLLGKSEEALALTRASELSTMDLRLVNLKKYTYALEDESNARNKLNTIIKSTISTITAAIKSLKDYRTALVASDKSNATPAERYASSKAALQSLASAAAIQGSTEAEKALQADALAKLPAASDAFLAASKELYASGAQYSSDFNTVLSILDTTSTALTDQKTTAELQLAQLESSSTLLGVIQENTKTTAELMQEYVSLVSKALDARAVANTVATDTLSSSTLATGNAGGLLSNSALHVLGVPGYASGGLASGISMVGENGPELVDFRTPARVYSNKASNDLLNTKELVDEIRSLRNEVAQLRKEQREQTGHIISSNYDANGKVAEAVNKTVDANLSNNAWLNRSLPKIA